jgi:drug/metabolite transporter (DMT)-like permease
MTPPVSRGWIAGHLLACSSMWATAFLFMKLTRGEIDPLILSSLRAVIGALTLMLIVGLLQRQSLIPAAHERMPWLVLGLLNGVIPNILAAFAITRMATGPAAMIQSAGPLATAILAHLAFTEERLTARRALGVGVGMLGAALLIGPKLFEGGAEALAVLAMLGLVACYASANIYTRTIKRAEPERLALGQQTVSAVLATMPALLFLGAGAYQPAAHHMPALIALGVIATGLPILVFMRLIRGAGPTRASMTGFLVPLIAVMIGVMVLGERLTLTQMMGGVVILAGVWLVTMARPSGARA